MTYIQNIVIHILLDDEPRSTAKAQSFALTDGMEPQSLMFADTLSGLHFNHIASFFAQISTDVIIIINLSKKADSLTILSLGINQMFLFCYLTNFIFNVMTDRENRFFQLPTLYLSQKIGLVLYWVRTCN